MDITSVSNASFSRSVTPAQSSRDRQPDAEAQSTMVENKAQQRAMQQHAVEEKQQQNKEQDQRRLDGRLISFAHEQDDLNSQQKKVTFNRSRVNDAYSSSKNELSNTHKQQTQRPYEREAEAIDIVV